MPANPRITIAQVDGSGTAVIETPPITAPYGISESTLWKLRVVEAPETLKSSVSSTYIMLSWVLPAAWVLYEKPVTASPTDTLTILLVVAAPSGLAERKKLRV